MNIADIIDYFRGVCRFTVSGMFPERFLNLCARSDIGLRDVRRQGDRITASVAAGRYRLMLPLARKCGVRLRVKKKSGLPFRILPYRKRAGLLLGFPLFFGLIWLLSLFVWEVDMPELSPGIRQEFAAAAERSGVRVGALRSGIDASLAEKEIGGELPELSWVGICVSGSRIVIDARELEPYEPPSDSSLPCNVVASDSGTVTLVEPGAGMPEVEAGQTVAQGDLLISGITELSQGSVIMSRASGKVWAKVYCEFTCEIPLRQNVPIRTGRLITVKRLSVLGIELPLTFGRPEGEAFEREITEWQLEARGHKFPLRTRTEYWYEITMAGKDISPKEAEELAEAEVTRKLEAVGAKEVVETSLNSERTDASVRVTLTAVVIKNIACQRDILLGD